jgi:pimeloyl-ACP methyl ester carboxylesterase
LAFIKDPRDKVDSAISLVYPVKWMNAKPTDIENQKYLTNREMAIAAAMARIERSRPQPLRGNIGQTAACLTHFVSDEKLRKIKEGDIAVLIVTGTDDCLVNPQNSYYLHDMIGGQFEVFEGSGHGLPGEQTKRYNQLIDEHFWKSSSGTK